MDSLYHKISSELDNLLHLSQMFATRPSGESAVNTTNDMQQNLQFMKMLNEQFAYMQLPLKLSSENAHGDLYVMTKKKLCGNRKTISRFSCTLKWTTLDHWTSTSQKTIPIFPLNFSFPKTMPFDYSKKMSVF